MLKTSKLPRFLVSRPVLTERLGAGDMFMRLRSRPVIVRSCDGLFTICRLAHINNRTEVALSKLCLVRVTLITKGQTVHSFAYVFRQSFDVTTLRCRNLTVPKHALNFFVGDSA